MSTPIPFVTLADPSYTEVVQVSPLVQRVVARNPSKYTYHGTGTYLIGASDVVVIDPGPNLDEHRDALARALTGRRVAAILVTHCHADHSPLAAWLRAETGAPTLGFGPHPPPAPDGADDEAGDEAGDDGTDLMDGTSGAADPAPAPAPVEESLDLAFDPDVRLGDGDVAAEVPGATLRAVHTPGHTSNHLCFALDQEHALFSGDHVMGWSTTVIAPPDGDMRAYLHSLRAVRDRGDRTLWPTHGAPITRPGPYLDALIAHRLEREAQVLAAVRAGEDRIAVMVRRLYADVRVELHRPARRSVLAHLVKLVADGDVVVDGGGPPRLDSSYHPASIR